MTLRGLFLAAALLAGGAPGPCLAEAPLPLYERAPAPDLSVWLAPGASPPAQLTAMDDDGRVCLAERVALRPAALRPCCGEARPARVADFSFGACRLHTEPSLLMPGPVEGLEQLPPYGPLPPLTAARFIGSAFVAAAAQPDQRSLRWTLRAGSAVLHTRRGGRELAHEAIRLDRCRYSASGAAEFLHCAPPADANGPRSGYSWSLMYHDGALVYATPDATGTGYDDFGDPFFYRRHDAVASYAVPGGRAYAFRPGYVLLREGTRWRRAARAALRYYGECDCPEAR